MPYMLKAEVESCCGFGAVVEQAELNTEGYLCVSAQKKTPVRSVRGFLE